MARTLWITPLTRADEMSQFVSIVAEPASKGRDAMTLFDYAAIGALIVLLLWAAAALLGRNKFKL